MKKIFLLFVILIGSLAFADDIEKYSKGFSVRFLHCLPTNQELTYSTSAGDVTLQRSLHGWKDHKCAYNEIITTGETTVSRSCNFSKDQVNEIVQAMKADPKGESVAEQVWERYRNLSEVCLTN